MGALRLEARQAGPVSAEIAARICRLREDGMTHSASAATLQRRAGADRAGRDRLPIRPRAERRQTRDRSPRRLAAAAALRRPRATGAGAEHRVRKDDGTTCTADVRSDDRRQPVHGRSGTLSAPVIRAPSTQRALRGGRAAASVPQPGFSREKPRGVLSLRASGEVQSGSGTDARGTPVTDRTGRCCR